MAIRGTSRLDARPAEAPPANQTVSSRRSPTTELPDRLATPAAAVELILDNIYDAVVTIDLDNRITYWAASVQRMFGYTAEQALGMSFGELLRSAGT